MTITNFREIHKSDAATLPLSKIHLTEHCHLNAVKNEAKLSALSNEPLCIVRRGSGSDENPEYNLVIGYRDYMTAKSNGANEIKAIVVPDRSRGAFIKSLKNTFEIWNTADVHEPKGWTPPNPEKIRACREMYENTRTFGKRIIISSNGTIIDGYAAVCAARLLGVEKLPVYILPVRCKNNPSKNRKKKILKTPLTKSSPYDII